MSRGRRRDGMCMCDTHPVHDSDSVVCLDRVVCLCRDVFDLFRNSPYVAAQYSPFFLCFRYLRSTRAYARAARCAQRRTGCQASHERFRAAVCGLSRHAVH